ncbi:MAG: hypothetical protein A3E37_04590 [Candidatus Andersenbacteria bacterium RIFCSPHIGHO2_12_FULL_46_9]|nr:MAG: Iron-containing alcohol dehydrogenase [Parcubacteria group bacterium GW2011_GWA2_45_14]OGY33598.1 MAG: hypothetical protein A3B76_04680 [Candidatus Andersenbacteria bacterium RIFCSPHIGHO2_02_FULL_46_16]OGY36470.1 MAG: hypothetical protein A3I08_04240 [Candidatus Andersenbacteria bacterium RIFCSPLOWO2_02_FULL_46_11]OGY37617.1 MAG: hypothetical protein A3E37_04590 [Candidatus Andersenbacteria bacterium RIFCSPHIGHO2_12_FULL_46_9]HBE89682.1 alcohol dehydrogenase [Candidatus Andersenbacteria
MSGQLEYMTHHSVAPLARLLKKYRTKHILIVTDNLAYTVSGAAEKYSTVLKPYHPVFFTDYTVNPKLPDIRRGLKLFHQNQINTVLAIGGGSAIDMAKLIAVFATSDKPIESFVTGQNKLTEKYVPLIAIPTTAGSGSEATHFAVIYHRGQKYSISHSSLLPDAAIIDSSLTLSLSGYQTAVSGADALCQAIESYWSVNSTPRSKTFSARAIKLILKHLAPSVKKGQLIDRTAMSQAAHLAGKAIDIAETTAPHALSYTLTLKYGIPHGQAVTVFLPSFLDYNSTVTAHDNNDSRGPAYVQHTLKRLFNLLSAQDAAEAQGHIKKLFRSIGLKTSLAELGIKSPQDIQKISSNVNNQRLANNPRAVTASSLLEIIKF